MINIDFSKRVVIDTQSMPWTPSPSQGVERKPLAREEAERGHATSIVRYAAGSRFPSHQHPGGEEILVLEGVFSDEHGDYGPGSYIRNPIGTAHAPFSESGCTLFVKLHQFEQDDSGHFVTDTEKEPWRPGIGNLKVMPLHQHGSENVALVWWPAGEIFQRHRHEGGEEILVLSGELQDEHGVYPEGTWIRSPHSSEHHPRVEKDTLIWVKTGHLPKQ